MLSIIQAICAVLFCIGVGGWWVACSLKREDLEKQIQQTLDAIDCACAYWGDKLADPAVSAHAQTYLVRLKATSKNLRRAADEVGKIVIPT